MGGNHINVTGNNNETVVDSTIGSISGVRTNYGESTATALKELAAFVQAERNSAAAAALHQMEIALAQRQSDPQAAQSHWRTLVGALPAIMQLPATLTVIRALFGE